jgi:GntR family transcriptional regulator, transcriptional repressor for pyruvate dehydrogenase complex
MAVGTEFDRLNQAKPSSGNSAVDRIVDQIRKIIASSKLTVGDSLPTERELCARFDASRNTIREAMRILKAYGLVEVRPKVGAVIVDNRMSRAFDLFSFNTMEVSRKTFADVQALRDLMEVCGAEQILERVDSQDIEELRTINGRLAHVQDLQEASEIDHAFHVRLVSILENAAILDVYNVMKPVILRIMRMGKTRRVFETETYAEHEGVIDALEARDRLAFQYRLRAHLMMGFKLFTDGMDASEEKTETT